MTRRHSLLAEAHTSFLSGESSRQGKAGAAWGCRPTEHPLPTPAGNPAVSFSSPHSDSARLLGKAGVSDPVGSPSRASHGPCALASCAFFDSSVSGRSASGSSRRKRGFRPVSNGYRKGVARREEATSSFARSSLTRQADFARSDTKSLLPSPNGSHPPTQFGAV